MIIFIEISDDWLERAAKRENVLEVISMIYPGSDEVGVVRMSEESPEIIRGFLKNAARWASD